MESSPLFSLNQNLVIKFTVVTGIQGSYFEKARIVIHLVIQYHCSQNSSLEIIDNI